MNLRLSIHWLKIFYSALAFATTLTKDVWQCPCLCHYIDWRYVTVPVPLPLYIDWRYFTVPLPLQLHWLKTFYSARAFHTTWTEDILQCPCLCHYIDWRYVTVPVSLPLHGLKIVYSALAFASTWTEDSLQCPCPCQYMDSIILCTLVQVTVCIHML